MKRRLKISTYINISMAFVLTVALALFAIVGAVLLRSASVDNTVSSLQVALQTAYDRMELKDTSEILRISEVLSYEDINGYFANRNEKKLSKVLDRCAPIDMGTPYTLAVDSEGIVLASNAQPDLPNGPSPDSSILWESKLMQSPARSSSQNRSSLFAIPHSKRTPRFTSMRRIPFTTRTFVLWHTRFTRQTAHLWEPSSKVTF